MTVCIAAICDNAGLIVAADRMMSAGDIEFEPTLSDDRTPRSPGKIVPLTNAIVAMTAGDAAFQAEAMLYVTQIINKRIQQEPQRWWTVKEVVDLCVDFYRQDRLRRVRDVVLSPFGLDEQTFIGRQKQMSEQFVRTVANQISQLEMPESALIVAGIDDTGVHIYKLYGANVECADLIGFASIGIGARHADSQFMLAGHHRSSPFVDTLLLTFVAKKRSEVAPGVGNQTDIFLVGPGKGAMSNLSAFINFEKLEACFTKIQQDESAAFESAKKEVAKYVREAIEKGQAQQKQQAQPPQPSSASNAPAGEH